VLQSCCSDMTVVDFAAYRRGNGHVPACSNYRVPDPKCEHKDFNATVAVNRIEDKGRYIAEIRITCAECGAPFRFIGLPGGLDLNGATTNIDGTEGSFAIAPRSQVLTPLTGTTGFTSRATVPLCAWCETMPVDKPGDECDGCRQLHNAR